MREGTKYYLIAGRIHLLNENCFLFSGCLYPTFVGSPSHLLYIYIYIYIYIERERARARECDG